MVSDGYVLSFLPVNGTPTGIRLWSPCAQQAVLARSFHQALKLAPAEWCWALLEEAKAPGAGGLHWPADAPAGSRQVLPHDYASQQLVTAAPLQAHSAQDATTQAQGLKTTK